MWLFECPKAPVLRYPFRVKVLTVLKTAVITMEALLC